MSSSFNLKSLGVDPYFPPLGVCYRSEKGFLVADELGGPDSLALCEKLEPRPDDIFVVSFPKTGTTLLQEMVYLIGTDVDVKKAKETHLMIRCPYLDWKNRPSNLDDVPSPRFLKFHLPYSLIPKSVLDMKCKVIKQDYRTNPFELTGLPNMNRKHTLRGRRILYPMRNPKDTLVSYYYFSKSDKAIGYNSDFETFFNLFLEDKVLYAPYWKHCLEFWERRHEDNIFITTYEDMKKDLSKVVRQVASFLGKQLTEEQVEIVTKHCSFDEMKKNPSTNPNLNPQLNAFLDDTISLFMRKGEVGDWKNHFTEEMNKRMDEYIAKNFGDIPFVYEINS